MAATIQVVLRDDVSNLGKTGELVRVKPGYARNFLIPQGLASVASRGNVEQIEHERRSALARAAKLRAGAQAVAQTLAAITVEIPMQVGENDRLYGSVTTRDVADALKAKGIEVDRKKIVLPDSIKQLGEFECSVRLGGDVHATFKLVVKKKS